VANAVLCRFYVHKWHREYNDQSEPYLICDRCGKYCDALNIMDTTNPGGKGTIGI
jgi:hypothetical protein